MSEKSQSTAEAKRKREIQEALDFRRPPKFNAAPDGPRGKSTVEVNTKRGRRR